MSPSEEFEGHLWGALQQGVAAKASSVGRNRLAAALTALAQGSDGKD